MGSAHNKNVRQKRNASQIMITDLESAYEELKTTKETKTKKELDDCYSVDEICEKLGETKRNTYNIIKDCMANGSCECAGKRSGSGIDGRITRTPVYRFKNKKKK